MINEPLAISVPAEVVQATSPPEEIPIPTSAETLIADETFGMRIFLLLPEEPPGDVAEFYREAMPAQGWTAKRAGASGGTYNFEFTKEDRIALVQVSTDPASGGTLLAILPRGVTDPALPLDPGSLFPSELIGPREPGEDSYAKDLPGRTLGQRQAARGTLLTSERNGSDRP